MTKKEQALALRRRTDRHYNCAQSVLVPYAGELGLTEEEAYRLGAHFGGGMRVGSVCGALTGGLMALGLMGCPQEAAEELTRRFREKRGTLNCDDLLAPVRAGRAEKTGICNGCVEDVAGWVAELK